MAVAHCPGCGLRIRSPRLRCPRCEALLVSAATGKPVARARHRLRVVAGAAGLLVTVGLGLSWMAGVQGTSVSSAPQATARSGGVGPPSDASDRSGHGAVRSASSSVPAAALDALREGSAAYAAGELEVAAARYEAALDQGPDNADAHNNLGQVLVRLGRAADALPHLDAAVAMEPARWAFRFNRARAYGQLDRWTEAVAEYREASRLFPDDYVTQFNLGLALLKLEDREGAVLALERAVALAPGEPSFLLTLGSQYLMLQRRDDARRTFERFLDLAPDAPEAQRVRDLLAAP